MFECKYLCMPPPLSSVLGSKENNLRHRSQEQPLFTSQDDLHLDLPNLPIFARKSHQSNWPVVPLHFGVFKKNNIPFL